MPDTPTFKLVGSQNVSYDLPVSFAKEIGRVILRWAFFENYVQRMIYATAFLGNRDSIPLGRVSIHEPKFPDRFDLLLKLASIRKIEIDKALIKTMKPKSRILVEQRNLLAHGIWTEEPGIGWIVQQTSGAWNQQLGGPIGSKRILPEAVPMTTQVIKDIVSGIDDLLVDTTKLHASFPGVPKT